MNLWLLWCIVTRGFSYLSANAGFQLLQIAQGFLKIQFVLEVVAEITLMQLSMVFKGNISWEGREYTLLFYYSDILVEDQSHNVYTEQTIQHLHATEIHFLKTQMFLFLQNFTIKMIWATLSKIA